MIPIFKRSNILIYICTVFPAMSVAQTSTLLCDGSSTTEIECNNAPPRTRSDNWTYSFEFAGENITGVANAKVDSQGMLIPANKYCLIKPDGQIDVGKEDASVIIINRVTGVAKCQKIYSTEQCLYTVKAHANCAAAQKKF